MTSATKRKLRKSLPLEDKQVAFLKDERRKYDSKFDAAVAIGVNGDTLERAILLKVVHEKTYIKLQGKFPDMFPAKDDSGDED